MLQIGQGLSSEAACLGFSSEHGWRYSSVELELVRIGSLCAQRREKELVWALRSHQMALLSSSAQRALTTHLSFYCSYWVRLKYALALCRAASRHGPSWPGYLVAASELCGYRPETVARVLLGQLETEDLPHQWTRVEVCSRAVWLSAMKGQWSTITSDMPAGVSMLVDAVVRRAIRDSHWISMIEILRAESVDPGPVPAAARAVDVARLDTIDGLVNVPAIVYHDAWIAWGIRHGILAGNRGAIAIALSRAVDMTCGEIGYGATPTLSLAMAARELGMLEEATNYFSALARAWSRQADRECAWSTAARSGSWPMKWELEFGHVHWWKRRRLV